MAVGWQQLLLVLVIVLVLFGGRGRISSLMGDMAKGIRSFRKGLNEEDEADNAPQNKAELKQETPVTPETETTSKKSEA